MYQVVVLCWWWKLEDQVQHSKRPDPKCLEKNFKANPLPLIMEKAWVLLMMLCQFDPLDPNSLLFPFSNIKTNSLPMIAQNYII
jgi:hypothetical protein